MRTTLVAALAAALAGGACPRPPRQTDEVRIAIEADPANLNPLLAAEALSLRITLGDVYEPLVAIDPATGTVVPALAASWSTAAAESEWTFRLRPGVTWHDGEKLTADDVRFTFELLREAPTPLAADFDDLRSVDAPTPDTVVLRFAGFRLGRAESLAWVAILPKHVFAGTPAAELASHAANRAPVGTGPYRFDSWEPGRAIALRRFDGYWGRRPPIERVRYRIIPDDAQALAQLRAGTVDLVTGVPDSLAQGLDDDLQPVTYQSETLLAVTWNCRTGPLADARVRRALTQLLDRTTIAREILHGHALLASGPWLPGAPAYDAAVENWPFSPDSARTLLGEAAASGLRVRLLVPQESQTMDRIGTIWQDDAGRAGVTLTIDTAPWSEVVRRARAGEFEGVAFSWTTGPEQDFFPRLHSGEGENYGGLADAEVDRLLEQIRTTPDRTARLALEHALHRRLHELEPVTIVSTVASLAVHTRRLSAPTTKIGWTPARLMSFATVGAGR